MTAANVKPGDQQAQEGLFEEAELPPGPVAASAASAGGGGGEARVLYAERHQVELRPVDLDALLAPSHPARTVWAFVQSMDLSPLYATIKS
jgi:hypothetical protein